MIKKISIFLVVILLVPVLAYGVLLSVNNLGDSKIEPVQVNESLERAIVWLVDHQSSALNTNNPLLWWMVMRSANLTRDPRLAELYFAYHKRYLNQPGENVWAPLFEKPRVTNLRQESISLLPDYNQYMLYGLNCSASLLNTDIIQRQMQTDFCSSYHPLTPACVANQMMGLKFRMQSQCGGEAELADQMTELQGKVARQLTFDPRVVDVYLHRVLMLLDTGGGGKLQSSWLQRVLDAQRADGGWAAVDPLIPIGAGKALGFSSRSIKVLRPQSNFHTTAQGLLILSLLQESPQLAGAAKDDSQ